jgi:hypothetical protein
MQDAMKVSLILKRVIANVLAVRTEYSRPKSTQCVLVQGDQDSSQVLVVSEVHLE